MREVFRFFKKSLVSLTPILDGGRLGWGWEPMVSAESLSLPWPRYLTLTLSYLARGEGTIEIPCGDCPRFDPYS